MKAWLLKHLHPIWIREAKTRAAENRVYWQGVLTDLDEKRKSCGPVRDLQNVKREPFR